MQPTTTTTIPLDENVRQLALETPAILDEHQPTLGVVDLQLKFVQVGVWEARRRWLAGQVDDLGQLLAHLDEDISLLRNALDGQRKRRRKRREKAGSR